MHHFKRISILALLLATLASLPRSMCLRNDAAVDRLAVVAVAVAVALLEDRVQAAVVVRLADRNQAPRHLPDPISATAMGARVVVRATCHATERHSARSRAPCRAPQVRIRAMCSTTMVVWATDS